MILDICLSAAPATASVRPSRIRRAPQPRRAYLGGRARRRGRVMEPLPATSEPGRTAPRPPSRPSGPEGPGAHEHDFILKLYLRDLADLGSSPGAATDADGLVLGHLRRVVHTAFDFVGYGLPLGDLINEGNLGLMRAAERFDPGRNVSFGYYAKPWIRVQMQRAVSYQAWPVSLPADYSWRHGQVLAAEERLTSALGRTPREAELAHECGLGVPAVRRLRSSPAPSFLPLESPCSGLESGLTLEEVLPDPAGATPDVEAMRGSDREFLDGLLDVLSATEQKAIRLRFGLDDGQPRTLAEVGQAMGYGRQGIHRIETVALATLRAEADAMTSAGAA